MYCKHCGQEIKDDAAFCKYCGGRIIKSTPEDVAEQPEEQPKSEKIDGLKALGKSFVEKMNKKIVYICAAAVLVLAVVVVLIVRFTSKGADDSISLDKNIQAAVDNMEPADASESAEEYTEDMHEVIAEDVSTDTSDVIHEDVAPVNYGDIITFGNYRGTPVSWEVLDYDDEKMLLFSKEILEFHAYDQSMTEDYESLVDTCWEQSEIREWLNNVLIYDLFNDDELSRICESSINNPDSGEFYNIYYPDYAKWYKDSTDSCLYTTDKLFLLNWVELIQYFGPINQDYCLESSSCKPALTLDDMWWLRSQGINGTYALNVTNTGYIYDGDGEKLDAVNNLNGVRPAMWVKR